MIYSSINESKILKADWMIKNPIGARVVSRREIEKETKDVVGVAWKDYLLMSALNKMSGGKQEMDPFFPAKYAIGKEVCIQRKMFRSALCVCGHEKGWHNLVDSKVCMFSQCQHKEFKPALYKIIGGCWHKDWNTKTVMNRIEKTHHPKFDNMLPKGRFATPEQYERMLESRRIHGMCLHHGKREPWGTRKPGYYEPNDKDAGLEDDLYKEAKLEGFETVKGWLDYYPKHGIDINKTWRVLMERIQ